MARKIRKRDGRIVDFDRNKILSAIYKATLDASGGSRDIAEKITDTVVSRIDSKYRGLTPTVENVQDLVESALIENRYTDIAKAYILYREKHKELRETKTFFGVRDDLKLGLNAIKVIKARYLLKNDVGETIETPSQMFRRVARAVAKAELKYDRKADVGGLAETFYNVMTNLDFLPNSPTLMNAGASIGQLSACFVIPVEDSLDSIFKALWNMAKVHQSGGGTGFSFSRLRPEGDVVRSTHGVASGPVSFMGVFDAATNVIKQGGKRHGANMGILNVNHPDIMKFITAKASGTAFSNFNLSVAVTDSFMRVLRRNKEIKLVNPRTGRTENPVKAKELFGMLIANAWSHGDPGIVFIDEINRKNTLPALGRIESTNPCGEAPLLPYESCNLGSINLSKVVFRGEIDWDKLGRLVRLGVHFLDNVININRYPLPEIERMTKANRKIGLGVMGFADMLVLLGIPYNSKKAVETAERVMKFITENAREASRELAKKRGSFPNFRKSRLKGYGRMRNATVTSVAPTGTISVIAGCSSGIEPLFAVTFVRHIMDGMRFLEANPIFEKIARERGFYSNELMMEIAKKGSLAGFRKVPDDVRKVFVTSMEIGPEWHVKMQAAFQKHTDLAVSKTVNLPESATPEDVKKIFLLAHKLKCKGITVYRYGSREQQVLSIGSFDGERVSAESDYSGGCPSKPYCEA